MDQQKNDGDQQKSGGGRSEPNWRKWLDITQSASIIALALSLLSFYRSYFYVNQQLEVTVTEVSYGTNQGELYMTVAFSNSGNRDAAVLRVESALWARRDKPDPEWVPVMSRSPPEIPIVAPRTPLVVKSGGVEVLKLSTRLNAAEAEKTLVSSEGGAFLGIRVATMNSDGNLYLLEHPVARLLIDRTRPNHGSRAGHSSDARRLFRPAGGSSRRLAHVEQADAVCLGRGTLSIAPLTRPNRCSTRWESVRYQAEVAAGVGIALGHAGNQWSIDELSCCWRR